MMDDWGNLKDAYRAEVSDLTAELEASLLQLEKEPANKEAVDSIFRAMHTIKGSGAMVGFDDIAEFSHQLETVYDLIRSGRSEVGKELIDLTFKAVDLIREMVGSDAGALAAHQDRAQKILSLLLELYPLIGVEEKKASKPTAAGRELQDRLSTYRIRFRPAPDIFVTGTNPLLLISEVCELGVSKVIAHAEEVPRLSEINPEACYTYWDIIVTTGKPLAEIRDIFIFVEDAIEIEVIDSGDVVLEDTDYKKIGEILLDRHDISAGDLDMALKRMLQDRKPIGEILIEGGIVDPSKVEAALAEQEIVRHIREERAKTDIIANLRVPAEKLDRLVNLVGELVTVQARLSQASLRKADPEFISISEEVERLTEELRENTMNIRMLPISTLFNKFRRLVRDLSNGLGKTAELTTEGSETELDKSMIEKLSDPLVHLIRNCVDHGIEMPEVRARAGKPKAGSIHLGAYHSGAYVKIEIRDDGAGMDPKRILQKAIEKGMVQQDAELAEKDIFNLVFLPNFSTAEKVTNVSGRGVGLDVLKRAIENLRGDIDVSSHKGHGTTITLTLPLTLAIIEGLLVRISDEHFVIPLSAVEECIELSRETVSRSRNRNLMNVRGQVVPYVHMREHFGIRGESPDIEQIVVLRSESTRVGLVVDSVIGEHQTVIKTLGRVYNNAEGISGATILGDGTVALIMDIAKIIRLVSDGEVETGK